MYNVLKTVDHRPTDKITLTQNSTYFEQPNILIILKFVFCLNKYYFEGYTR